VIPIPSLSRIVLIAVTVPSIAYAWTPDGSPVCTADGVQSAPVAIGDGAGGVFVAWVDQRAVSPGIYAQHVLFDGSVEWASNGVRLSGVTPVNPPRIVPDGAGGALVIWPTGTAIQAQRIDAGGTIHAGWPANGKVITTDLTGTSSFAAVTDGSGGAYITRGKTTSGPFGANSVVMLTRIDANGGFVAPWTESGTVLRSSNSTNQLALETDPTGGALCGLNWWIEGGTQPHFGQAERRAGDATQTYTMEPINPFAGSSSHGVFHIAAAPDGAGGSYWTWRAVSGQGTRYFGQHLTSGGIKLWAEPYTVPFSELAIQDGANGVWLVGRPPGTNQLEVHRRLPNGTLPAGWTPAGQVISSPVGLGAVAAQSPPGRVLLCWSQNTGTGFDLRAIAVADDGTLPAGWSPGGNSVCAAAGDQKSPSLALTGSTGIACWEDQRNGAANQDIYAMLLGDQPVAIQVSLVDASTGTLGNVNYASVMWYSSGGLPLATVERKGPSDGEWVGRSSVTPDGSGYLNYSDLGISPGRYGYRLTWTELDGVHHSDEAWVDVPGTRLAIVGFGAPFYYGPHRPTVVFELSGDEPATMDVLDVLGRRAGRARIDWHGPGRHEVLVDALRPLDPGVYVIRLTQGEKTVTRKALLLRYWN
jgi:hypothetical protein